MNAIKLGAVGEAAALKMWSFRNKFSRKAPNINLPFALQKMKIEYITSVAAHLTNQLSGSNEEVNPHLMSSYIKRLEAKLVSLCEVKVDLALAFWVEGNGR